VLVDPRDLLRYRATRRRLVDLPQLGIAGNGLARSWPHGHARQFDRHQGAPSGLADADLALSC
jgi:hypothetical protein